MVNSDLLWASLWPGKNFFDPNYHHKFPVRAYSRACILFLAQLCNRTIQHEHLALQSLLYCRIDFYKNRKILDLGILHLRYELEDRSLLLKKDILRSNLGHFLGHCKVNLYWSLWIWISFSADDFSLRVNRTWSWLNLRSFQLKLEARVMNCPTDMCK